MLTNLSPETGTSRSSLRFCLVCGQSFLGLPTDTHCQKPRMRLVNGVLVAVAILSACSQEHRCAAQREWALSAEDCLGTPNCTMGVEELTTLRDYQEKCK